MAGVMAFCLVALVAQPAAAATAACRLPTPHTVFMEEGASHAKGARLLQMWEVPNAPVWWSQAEPEGYASFRARVVRHVSETDPVKLLAQVPSRNNAIVAESAQAWIKPASCLEKLLQQVQDQRLDTFVEPTEFVSAVLVSRDQRRLRVYYYTANQNGIGRMTPVTDLAIQARSEGWSVRAVLHNHAFHPDQPLLNSALAPSLPDAQFNVNFAERVGLAEAWITNGLHTTRIPAAAFGRFERSP